MSDFVRGPLGPDAGADCASCPLAIGGKPSGPVAGIGPEDPDWIVIGEGPGNQEVKQGLPFVGPTGSVLNRALKETGSDRRRLWVTNTASCRTDTVGDAERAQAATACRGRLATELATMPGKPMLLLGGVVTKELVASPLKITRLTGTYHEIDVDGSGPRPVIPSLHPAYFLHSGGGKGGSAGTAAMGFISLKFDINKVKAIASGRSIKLDFDIDTEITNAAIANLKAQRILAEAVRDGFLGIDLETYVENEQRHTALQPFAARIRLLGLSTRTRALSVLWDHLTPKTIAAFRAALASVRVTKCYHNMVYEHSVLQNDRYRFVIAGPQEDTMLAHHAAFPGSPHNLQATACQFRGIPPWKAEFRDGDETLPEEAIYNAQDAYCTVKTLEPLHVWIKKTQTQAVYDIDRKKAALAARMHLWGYHVDGEVNAELTRRLSTAVTASRAQLLELFESNRDKVIDRLAFERAKVRRKADPEEFVDRIPVRKREEEKLIAKMSAKDEEWFAPGKDMHMIALLKTLGVPLLKLTETGRTSTSAGVLEDLGHHPVVASLLRYRSNDKLLKTFVIRQFEWVQDSSKKWLPPFVQDDGRVHPVWSPNKLSGRWGSENPGCFDGDTEILTRRGWVKFSELLDADAVAQYDKDTREITFAVPTRHVREHYVGSMVSWQGTNVDLLMTPNHRVLLHHRKTNVLHSVVHADALRRGIDYRVPTAGSYSGSQSVDPTFVKLVVATQADGSFAVSRAIQFGFTKQRKAERLRQILVTLGAKFTESAAQRVSGLDGRERTVVSFYVHAGLLTERVHALLTATKSFGSWLLNWDGAALDVVLDEIMFWDGCWTRRNHYASSVRQNADWVQAIAHLRGRRGRMRSYFPANAKIQRKTSWQIDVCPRASFTTSELTVTHVPWSGMVYCVTVPKEFIVVRRGGSVVITGNSQNVSEGDESNKDPSRRLPNLRRQYTAPERRRLIGFDMEQLEARTMALQSDDPFLCRIFADKQDIHAIFAALLFADFTTLVPKCPEWTDKRNITKRLEYGGLYGGADETVWKSIIVDFPNVTLGMVSIAIKKMKLAVAGVLRWQQNLLLACSRPPYELTSYILKRRRVFPLGDPSPTDVNNNPNQFTGADIMDIGTVNFMETWEKARWRDQVMMLKQIHDAAYFEVPDDDRIVDEIGWAIKDAWTQTHVSASGIAIDFPIELKHGYALHSEPSPQAIAANPDLAWTIGRPGMVKLKLSARN